MTNKEPCVVNKESCVVSKGHRVVACLAGRRMSEETLLAAVQ